MKVIRLKILKPRLTYRNLIFFEIWFNIFAPFLISEVGMPRNILYIADLFNVCIFTYSIATNRKKKIKNVNGLIISICVIGFLGYIFQGGNLLLYIWGLRNVLRYFIFILNCVSFLYFEDIEKILDVFQKLIFINVFIGLFQYFILKKQGDFLGAMFGTARGANGYLIAYLCVVLVYCLAKFVYKKMSITRLCLSIISILLLSVLAELKIMFFLILFCVAITAVITKPTIKTIGIVIMSTGILLIGLWMLETFNPVSFSYISNREAIQWYIENGYTGSGGFSRTNGIAGINRLFFRGDLLKILFGMGLGQCDYSNVSVLSSRFYEIYGYLNYRLFFCTMTYLEMGICGLLAYIIFLIRVLVNICKDKVLSHGWIKLMSILSCIIIAFIGIYNYTLRSEPGYIWALIIAAAVIIDSENRIYLRKKK